MDIKQFHLTHPTAENGFCIFGREFEDDPEVFFHGTAATNFDSILKKGFLSAYELFSQGLESVSYAKRSSGFFANLGCIAKEDLVIFVVRFTPADLKKVVDNPSDIHVYNRSLQPDILGYIWLPEGFNIS